MLGSSWQAVTVQDVINKSWNLLWAHTQHILNDVSLILSDESLKDSKPLMGLNHPNSCRQFFLPTEEAIALNCHAHV